MKPPEDMEQKIRNASVETNEAIDTRILKMMRNAYDRSSHLPAAGQVTSRKPVFLRPASGLAVAVAVVVVVLIVVNPFASPNGGLAFGEVLANMAHVQSFHGIERDGDETREIWAKRPNMLRCEDSADVIEISNGPTLWVVNTAANTATQRPSYYFDSAQRNGLDVVDSFLRMDLTEGLSGFFSEGPVERITQEGKVLDVYRMEFTTQHGTVHFEALVDAGTKLISSMSAQVGEDEFVFAIDEYDIPLSDDLFSFEPDATMDVVVKEAGATEVPQASAEEVDGSVLSGRIIWASNGEPVVGARLTLAGGPVRATDGTWRPEFFETVETGHDGYWTCLGVPVDNIRIIVRSWEFEWPAVPVFAMNTGSQQRPRVDVDGHSEYGGLDFEVYKPDDFYAHITANVINEDGLPVENASASLAYVGGTYQSIQATQQGGQFTGPDGRIEAYEIWPTATPVVLEVGVSDPDGPYPARAVTTQPFTIESQGDYHFDIAIPYKREMTVQVVDVDGNPVEGISVALHGAQDGLQISPVSRRREDLPVTDADGLVDLSDMLPGENVLVVVRRFADDGGDVSLSLQCPLASVVAPATAPINRDKPFVQVVFDERPIVVEGQLDAVGGTGFVYTTMPQDDENGPPASLFRVRTDSEGRFTLSGVPAGTVKLGYSVFWPDNTRADGAGLINVEPGNRYRVQFTDDGLRVLDVQPIP